MGKRFRIFWVLIPILFHACQTANLLDLAADRQITDDHFDRIKPFRLKELHLDYIAKCKVRIKTPEGSQSGSCDIVITHDRKFRMTVYSPIGGSFFDLYLDTDKIQVLDRSEKTYYLMRNNLKNRKRISKILDLNMVEFQSLFWGREILNKNNQLVYTFETTKPKTVTKITTDINLKVSYRHWLRYRDAWFPKMIVFEDQIKQLSIQLIITDFTPGVAEDPEIKNIPQNFAIKS